MTDRLISSAAEMGIPVSPEQAEAFVRYHSLLTEANRSMNLTRVPEDPTEAIDRNYLDSIALLSVPGISSAKRLADVGSGAGFPGIPLSILMPETGITLLDALDKRVSFLNGVIETLSLNAEALHMRAEEAGHRSELRERFDLVTSRAVAPLNILSELCLPLVRTGGIMAAWKGPAWEEELKQAEKALSLLGGTFREAVPVRIPGQDWEHVLVLIEKTAPTPEKYPRRPGMPEKRPL